MKRLLVLILGLSMMLLAADIKSMISSKIVVLDGIITDYDANGDNVIDVHDQIFVKSNGFPELIKGSAYKLHGVEPSPHNVFGWSKLDIEPEFGENYRFAFSLGVDADNDGSLFYDWFTVSSLFIPRQIHKIRGVSSETTIQYSDPVELGFSTFVKSSNGDTEFYDVYNDPSEFKPRGDTFLGYVLVFAPQSNDFLVDVNNSGKSKNALGYYGDGVMFGDRLIVGQWFDHDNAGGAPIYPGGRYIYYLNDGWKENTLCLEYQEGCTSFNPPLVQYGVSEDGKKLYEDNFVLEIIGTIDGCYELKKTFFDDSTPGYMLHYCQDSNHMFYEPWFYELFMDQI